MTTSRKDDRTSAATPTTTPTDWLFTEGGALACLKLRTTSFPGANFRCSNHHVISMREKRRDLDERNRKVLHTFSFSTHPPPATFQHSGSTTHARPSPRLESSRRPCRSKRETTASARAPQYTARLPSTSFAHRIIPPSMLNSRDDGTPCSLSVAHAFALRPPTCSFGRSRPFIASFVSRLSAQSEGAGAAVEVQEELENAPQMIKRGRGASLAGG